MAKFRNLLIIEADFTKIPNKFFEIFAGNYDEMILLIRLMNTMETFNSWNKLTEDKTFYISLNKIIELYKGHISKPTIIKYLDDLEKKGFIKKEISYNSNQANYYQINCEKINRLCKAKTEQIFEEDEIEELVVTKNATAVKENSENKSVGYNLKSAEDNLIESKWNTIAVKYDLAKIINCKEDRIKKFKNILKFFKLSEDDFFRNIDKAILESRFLRGLNSDWKCNFDFFLQRSSLQKTLEGVYKDNNKAKVSFKEIEDQHQRDILDALKRKYAKTEVNANGTFEN